MSDDFAIETTTEQGVSTQPTAAEVDESAGVPEPEPVADEADSPESPETVETAEKPVPQPREPDGQFKTKAKKGSLQWRIDQKHWEATEARRQLQAERDERQKLSARLQELEQAQKPAQPPAAKPAAKAEGRPSLDQFESYEDYVEAVADWKAESRIEAERASYARRQQADEELQRRSSYHQRQEQFAATVPDYWEVVHNSAGLKLSDVMVQAVLTSESGPAIIYYLSTHPEEVNQLNQETERFSSEAAPLMRRLLEARIPNPGVAASYRPAQPSAVRQVVPAPIKPVGSGHTVAEPSSDDLSLDDHVREMNRREKKPLPRTFA